MLLCSVSPTAQTSWELLPRTGKCPKQPPEDSEKSRKACRLERVKLGGEDPQGWVSFTFASKENSSFCFSVSGSNYFLLVLCTFSYSSRAQGRTVSQSNTTWFSAGLQTQSINVRLVNKGKNKFHFRFCLFWTLHAHQNSRSKVAPCFFTEGRKRSLPDPEENPVWGTPGTIMHKFYTQIHGRGSQLAVKQERFLIPVSAPENRGSTRCPCWVWLGQAPNGHQLERETALILGGKVPGTEWQCLQSTGPEGPDTWPTTCCPGAGLWEGPE